MRVIYREKTLKALSISLPLTLISLDVPTEPCQVDNLRYKKKHTHTEILKTKTLLTERPSSDSQIHATCHIQKS